MGYPVMIVQVAEQPLAVSRQRTDLSRVSQEIGKLLETPWELLRANPDMHHRGRNVAVYHVTGGEVSVEVGVEVLRSFDATETVGYSTTPAGPAATAVYFGPYRGLGEMHSAINVWCQENGHQQAGISWEVYGHWDDDPAKLRTDVFYLLQ